MAKKYKNKFNPIESVLDLEFQDTDSQEKSGPVKVLGMTFANDEERRIYFREQLRAKLPELRKIEGFPIGSDDDIINLSDPPYYTACPNPWLNDFIAEWEQEKLQLEAEGKRMPNFEVREPYSVMVKSGKNSAIYNAHGYHTKVPHEIIMRYILHYTQPGDIIADSFAGTGMTGVACSACENPTNEVKDDIEAEFRVNNFNHPTWGIRHAICGDLSPLCFHISTNYNSSQSIKRLKIAVDDILKQTTERFGHFYTFKTIINNKKIDAHINYFVWSEIVGCNQCGARINVHDTSFDYDTKTLHKVLTCPVCGAKQERKNAESIYETVFDEHLNHAHSQIKYECCLLNYTIDKLGRFFSTDILEPNYPKFIGSLPLNEINIGDKFFDPKRVGVNHIHQFYFKRTQYVLAYISELINQYDKDKQALRFIFTSMIPKLTKMNRYMPQHGSRALVGPMANTLYIPPQCVENNPIDQFEYQAKKVIKAFEQCRDGAAIQIASATHSSILPESVDYVFTDPPFGANIMYSELNIISESWLNLWTNNSEEVISNKTQNKGFDEYHLLMTRSFEEYYRILKPGHWMTVEFSNTSAAFWNGLQNAIRNAGFVISSVTNLDKERGGLHAMIGPVAVKQDLAISCFKPSKSMIKLMSESSIFSDAVWSVVDEILNHQPVHISKSSKSINIIGRDPRILYDRLISFYVQHGLQVPINAHEFQTGLRNRYVERDGMFFTSTQAVQYDIMRKKTQGFQPSLFFVDSEQGGIAWLNNELATPKTYQDLQPKWMQAINGVRRGDILPELIQILEENFIKEPDGHWRRPNLQDDVDLAALRQKALLREFKIYVEVANKPKGKLREARSEALIAGFMQAYKDKDFATIVRVAEKIPQTLLQEDGKILALYQNALGHV